MVRRRDPSRQRNEHRGLDELEPVRKRDEELETLEGLEDVLDEDLSEFLAADALPCMADPGFRERLREKLWGIVSGDPEGPAVVGNESIDGEKDSED